MKGTVIAATAAIGGFLSHLFGAWSAPLSTLAIFMAADYITGFLVAAVFKNSPKSKSGALESRAGFKGLLRKGSVLLVVIIAHRLDIVLNLSFVRDGVVIAYIINEAVSIIENIGLMGLPIPDTIKKAIDLLKEKE